ncbi:MAG: 3-deoxy-7-phosphoheptulonate synthase [Polyangiaceae bacterium]|nr:3-deoxy-7-phosphoheptulonate synthase [Polyangiaceae bacterium]
MIVSLNEKANPAAVKRELVARGLWIASELRDGNGAVRQFSISPGSAAISVSDITSIEGVDVVTTSKSEHPLVDKQGPVVQVAGITFGGGNPVWMCGPCSVESEDQLKRAAERLASFGVPFLRGGAFKPRTSPYAFQGHGRVALGWLRKAADANGMRVVTEALSEGDVGTVSEHADMLQVGSRNMHNYALLKSIGATKKPVLLKRGMAATLEEWLLAGEYLLGAGAQAVVFCERGIRSFDDTTRNLLDLGAVAILSHVVHAPVIVDPSHGTGRRDLILPMGRAALAAGAAGLMIETHDNPGEAKSDGPQAIFLDQMGPLLKTLQNVGNSR